MQDSKPHFYHELKWIDTLIYFDGPLLNLYERTPGQFYLGSWADETTLAGNRAEVWLFWEVAKTEVPGKEPDPSLIQSTLTKTSEALVVTLVDDPSTSTAKVVAHEFISPALAIQRYMQEEPATTSSNG